MNIDWEPGFARSLQGQLLRHSERREVAIFLQDGVLWVADFIDGEGMLVDAATWFRFNCGALSSPHGQRRMVLESATPLSGDMVVRIGRLQRAKTMSERGLLFRVLAAVSPSRVHGRAAALAARVLRRRPVKQGGQMK